MTDSISSKERTAWQKGVDQIHCANCGYTWDAHICDGRSTCPLPKSLRRYTHTAEYMINADAGPWVSWHDASMEIDRLRSLLDERRAHETSAPRHQTPNQRARDTMSTMRSVLARGEPLYSNDTVIRLTDEAATNLLDEFEQALRERDYYIAAHDRACQETREVLAREAAAARSAPETTAPLCVDCLELKNALAAAVGVANEAREYHDRDNDMRVMKLLLALSGHVKGYRADTDRIHDVLKRAADRFTVKSVCDVPNTAPAEVLPALSDPAPSAAGESAGAVSCIYRGGCMQKDGCVDYCRAGEPSGRITKQEPLT